MLQPLFSSKLKCVTHLRRIDMSANAQKVVVGSVVRRPCEEVVKEMAGIAEGERARIVAHAAPTPTLTPSPGCYSQRHPIKHRRPVNPAPPEPRQVAAVRTSWADDKRERWLLERADERARRPRTPTPPRRKDDHYDLARWSMTRRR